jgi:hypothetical protein
MSGDDTTGFVFGEQAAPKPYTCVCGERFAKPGNLGNHVRYNDGHYPRREWDDKDTLARLCTRMKAPMTRLPGIGLLESKTGVRVDRPVVTPPVTSDGTRSRRTGRSLAALRETLFDSPAESAVALAGLLLGIQFLCAPQPIGKATLYLLMVAFGVEAGGLVGASSLTTIGDRLPKRWRDLASSKKLRDEIHYFAALFVAGVALRYANFEYAITARLGIDQYFPGCGTTFLDWTDVLRAVV